MEAQTIFAATKVAANLGMTVRIRYDERAGLCGESTKENEMNQKTQADSSAPIGCSGVTDIPAVSRNVQWTPAIAILMDELKDWRAGVEWLKERKLDFRCEMASVKALERAIRRITAGDTKSSSAGDR